MFWSLATSFVFMWSCAYVVECPLPPVPSPVPDHPILCLHSLLVLPLSSLPPVLAPFRPDNPRRCPGRPAPLAPRSRGPGSRVSAPAPAFAYIPTGCSPRLSIHVQATGCTLQAQPTDPPRYMLIHALPRLRRVLRVRTV